MRIPVFRRIKHGGIIISGLILSALLFAGCDYGNTLEPQGPVAASEAGLFWFILVVATIVFVAVEGMLIYSIIRYRARPNTPEPRQLHGNNTLELIWTVAPSLFLFAVLAGTIYTMFQLQQPASPNTLVVQAIGHQWWWEFKYPNQNISTADTLYVPKDTVVEVDLVSNNVIHSFWIPKLTGKTDDIPGHNNTRWFKADQAGTYLGECAEYCGTQHAHMEFNVVVLDSRGTFDTWLSTQQAAAQAATGLAANGQKIFTGAGGCTGCHGIVGVNIANWSDDKTSSGLPVTSLVGPNLTHFGSRSLIAGGVLSANNATNGGTWANDPACSVASGHIADKAHCGLYQWLHDPQGVKPGNDMNISPLTDDQIDALAAYLESLK